jgi:hypothetical protein
MILLKRSSEYFYLGHWNRDERLIPFCCRLTFYKMFRYLLDSRIIGQSILIWTCWRKENLQIQAYAHNFSVRERHVACKSLQMYTNGN